MELKISLDIKSQKVELTVEEVKELRDDLNKLLDNGYYIPYYPNYRRYPYYYDGSSTFHFDDTINITGYIHSNEQA